MKPVTLLPPCPHGRAGRIPPRSCPQCFKATHGRRGRPETWRYITTKGNA